MSKNKLEDILETALLAERLEVARNLPYDQVGIMHSYLFSVVFHGIAIFNEFLRLRLIRRL
jgi:hypothetical protein